MRRSGIVHSRRSGPCGLGRAGLGYGGKYWISYVGCRHVSFSMRHTRHDMDLNLRATGRLRPTMRLQVRMRGPTQLTLMASFEKNAQKARETSIATGRSRTMTRGGENLGEISSLVCWHPGSFFRHSKRLATEKLWQFPGRDVCPRPLCHVFFLNDNPDLMNWFGVHSAEKQYRRHVELAG